MRRGHVCGSLRIDVNTYPAKKKKIMSRKHRCERDQRDKKMQRCRMNKTSIPKLRCYSWYHLHSPDSYVAALQTEQHDGVSSLAPFSAQETENNGGTMEMR